MGTTEISHGQKALLRQLLSRPIVRYAPTPLEVLAWRAKHDPDPEARANAGMELDLELRTGL